MLTFAANNLHMYRYVLALHIIFIVTWFAGLFYIIRLFIYHTEAEQKPEAERLILQTQFKIMEKRLWYGITWPSMVLTLIFGPWLVYLNQGILSNTYFILKLCFVAGLVLYHFQTHIMFTDLQNDRIKSTSTKLRIWNEIATVFLVAIVFLIILKSNKGFIYGMVGLVIFTVTLMLAIKIYKKTREKKEKTQEKK